MARLQSSGYLLVLLVQELEAVDYLVDYVIQSQLGFKLSYDRQLSPSINLSSVHLVGSRPPLHTFPQAILLQSLV